MSFTSSPNYEDPTDTDTDNQYDATIQASDGTNTITITVTITVLDANEAPQFPSGTDTRTVAENTVSGQDIGRPVTATDPEKDDLTYILGGPDAGAFNIVESSGQLRTRDALDFESDSSYTVIVEVRDSLDDNGDSDTATDDTITVTINVSDVNEASPEFDTENTARVIPEDTPADRNIGDRVVADDPDHNAALTYTLSGADKAFFNIEESSGQLQTKASLDFESRPTYSVSVSVHDGKDANGDPDTTVDDTIAVTISVTDVNEPPQFPSSAGSRRVAENTGPGGNVGAPVAAIDPDSGDTLTYSMGGADAGAFSIDPGTGQITVGAATTLDHNSKPTYSVTVSVLDGKDGDGNPDATTDDTITVTITVTSGGGGNGGSSGGGGGGGSGGAGGGGAPANREPVFSDRSPVTLSVPEDTAEGASFGQPVAATDEDDDALTYTLGGDDAESFAIDSRSGQLKAKAALDYETRSRYSLEVSVTDGKGGSDTIAVTVRVINVDEPPTITGPATAMYEENGADAVATYTATDPEETEVTLSLTGDDAGAFSISEAGVLTFASPPDYEAPADVDTDNVYQVTVQATDISDFIGTLEVAITVTQADDAGIVSRYDADNNGLINKDEVLAALFDYFADLITKPQAMEVVNLYFAS